MAHDNTEAGESLPIAEAVMSGPVVGNAANGSMSIVAALLRDD